MSRKQVKKSSIKLENGEYRLLRALVNAATPFILPDGYVFHSLEIIQHKPGTSIKVNWREYRKTGKKKKTKKKTAAIKYCDEVTVHCQGVADFKLTGKDYENDKYWSQFICYKCLRYPVYREVGELFRKIQRYRIWERIPGRINEFEVRALAVILTGEPSKEEKEAAKNFLSTVEAEEKRPKAEQVKNDSKTIITYFEEKNDEDEIDDNMAWRFGPVAGKTGR